MAMVMRIVLVIAILLNRIAAQPRPVTGVDILSVQAFKTGISAGEYQVILDVRTQSEWDSGHIAGATLAENLATFGTSSHQGASPDDMIGCEFCSIAVYCRSGARASTALEVLQNAGFKGKLYNGQGIYQWESVGFELAQTPSVPPTCTLNTEDQCKADNNTATVNNSSEGGTLDSPSSTMDQRFSLIIVVVGFLALLAL